VLDALRYFPLEASARVVQPGVLLKPLPPREGVSMEGLPEKEEGLTWNGFVEKHYAGLIEGDSYSSRQNRLRRAIKDAEMRLERKLKNLYGDRETAGEELNFQKYGELLVSNLGGVKRGAGFAELVDYTLVPPEKVKIPLDGSLTPRENADRYFKKSRKARTALGLLEKRVPETEEELDYINSLMYEWENLRTEEDLEELAGELLSGGYLKAPAEISRAARPEAGEPIRRFSTSDGFVVLCGKSSRGNDLIVKKHMKEGDIWLHAANIPGSHVLVKAAGKEVTDRAVLEAAELAAFYSKARDAKKAEVIFTEARNIKKPRGAKPGMVVVREYKTIIAGPKVLDER